MNSQTIENKTSSEWLCRNCNTLVSGDTNTCPKCRADRPEEDGLEQAPSEIAEAVEGGEYANNLPKAKDKYTFRERVLINAADILFIIGGFLTLATLISPMFITEVANMQLYSICGAAVIFAASIIQWALLRTIADISQRLRTLCNKQ